jgi:ADP-L-glycero-D-manno-heptose 6-epimerase
MILVTGGAGFIGSNIVSALCQRGGAVTVCDRLRDNDKWRNIAKAAIADVVAPEDLDGWLATRPRLEAIVHMGAISSTTVMDADMTFDVNVRLSTRLWDWCAAHDAPFIYASSAATYGAGEQGFDDADDLESLLRLRPLNAYGWSKCFFDRRVASYIARGEPAPPQWVGLKFFNVYGPNEYHKGSMQSVVAQKFPQLASGAPITLFTSHHPRYRDGEQLRDFVYVRDCVDVVLWLLGKPHVNGVFNLGTGQARSFADLARAMAAALGVPSRIQHIPMPEAIRPNYQYFTQANMTRLQKVGYDAAFTPLEEGVRDYVVQFLAKADKYR